MALAALALQPSTPPVLFGRYSPTAAAVLAALLVTAPLVGWLAPRAGAVLAGLGLGDAVSWTVAVVAGGVVTVLWALPVASAPAYSVLRVYITGVTLTLGLWGLERLQPAEGLHWWVMLAPYFVPALVLTTTAALFGLTWGFPGVRFVDEAYMASLAWNFGNTGRIAPLIYDPVDTESYALMYMGLGLWYRVVGFGLWAGRAFVYLVGLGALAATWAVARRAYGTYAAWVGVLLGAFALVPLNLLRQDVSVAVYLALALLAYGVAVERARPPLHLVVGFLVAFATDGHPNAYRFSLAFGAAYLLEWALLWRAGGRVVYWPLLYLVVGGVLGVASYVGLYAWLGDDFLTLAASPVLTPTAAPPLVFLEQLTVAVAQTPLLFGAAALGLVVGLRAGQPLTRLVAVVLLVNMGVLAALYGYYRAYYVAQSVGLYVVLAAALFGALPRTAGARVRVGLVVFVLGANVGLLLNRYGNDDLRAGFNPALAVGAALREQLPAGATVVGTDPMYFGLADHVTFVEYAAGGWAAAKFNVAEADVWADVAPGYVVMFYANPIPPPDALQAYMRGANMIPVACWESARLGRIDLFATPAAAPDAVRNPPRSSGAPRLDRLEPASCEDIS